MIRPRKDCPLCLGRGITTPHGSTCACMRAPETVIDIHRQNLIDALERIIEDAEGIIIVAITDGQHSRVPSLKSIQLTARNAINNARK